MAGDYDHLFESADIAAGNLTDRQIEHVFRQMTGRPPGPVDYLYIETYGRTEESLARHLWDHWFGEPFTPSLPIVQARVHGLLEVPID